MTVRVRLLNSISLDLLGLGLRLLSKTELWRLLSKTQLWMPYSFIDGISLGTSHYKVGLIGKFNNNILIMDRM